MKNNIVKLLFIFAFIYEVNASYERELSQIEDPIMRFCRYANATIKELEARRKGEQPSPAYKNYTLDSLKMITDAHNFVLDGIKGYEDQRYQALKSTMDSPPSQAHGPLPATYGKTATRTINTVFGRETSQKRLSPIFSASSIRRKPTYTANYAPYQLGRLVKTPSAYKGPLVRKYEQEKERRIVSSLRYVIGNL